MQLFNGRREFDHASKYKNAFVSFLPALEECASEETQVQYPL